MEIAWLIRNWRLVAFGLAVIGIAGIAAYIYHKGRSDKEAEIEIETLKEDAKTREKFDEIRNAPLDFDGAIEWLRDHKL